MPRCALVRFPFGLNVVFGWPDLLIPMILNLQARIAEVFISVVSHLISVKVQLSQISGVL